MIAIVAEIPRYGSLERITMNTIITYGSRYGTTKRYARELSEITGIPLLSEADIKDLSSFNRIIHLGGLYAGRVKGLKKVLSRMSKQAELCIVTVGLGDVKNELNTDKIKKDLAQQVPKDILKRARIFHLRGGIDYSRLSFIHRTMMGMLCKRLKAMPEDKKTAEIQDMIDTFGQRVDFTDFSALKPIAEAISQS